MGCDIHLYAERKRETDHKWERVHPPVEFRDPWYVKMAAEDRYYAEDARTEWFSGRNYSLFAMLAGVRNYDEIEPLCEPRGIPDDLSPELLSIYRQVDDGSMGDHSFSWLTLGELAAVDWAPAEYPDFPDRLIPGLATLGAPDDVRVVFGFDN